MSTLRDNWRVVFLVAAILLSIFTLFSPTTGSQSPVGEDDSATNLQSGLQPDGGMRIRAPLVGATAEDVEFEDDSERVVERQVTTQIAGADAANIIVRTSAESSTVEATIENVTADDLGAVLDAAGCAHDEVRDGATGTTRAETVRVLQSKINEAGLSGGTVQQVTTVTGEHFILAEVPNRDQSDIVGLAGERGTVQIDICYPTRTDNGLRTYETRGVVPTQIGLTPIGTAQESQTGSGAFVPVFVRDGPVAKFRAVIQGIGLAQPGGTRCTYVEDGGRNATKGCLLFAVGGEVVNVLDMNDGLTGTIRAGEWAGAPNFRLQTRNTSEVQEIVIDLRAGALPTRLGLSGEDSGTSSYISPNQRKSFRFDSLITGIVAVLAVAGVVFIRCGKLQVALPMIVTGLSKVYILLGFAATIGYPLDLSVIADFTVVIGTEVNDLIIITNKVMDEGSMKFRKVFQSRLHHAFWVIGAATTTAIITVSPLAVLSLGDLRDFAIFTILGIVVDVLITHPAYGDILRPLLTEDR